ncbi:MAG: hypothetical protein V4537_14445 [Pseudomonadota bacterium]
MSRARKARRSEQRAASKRSAKLRKRVAAEMARTGLAARIRLVQQAVSDGALFWRILKARIAAVETFRPIKDVEEVRATAMEALAELEVDTAGVQLKVVWSPPVLRFEALPTMEAAVEAVEATNPEVTAPG